MGKISKKGGKIGDKVIALETEKQSAFTKAVKHVEKLKAQKDQAAAEAALNKRGIILLSHIPHGFFEQEMKQYFSQFGKVTRLRHARSKKTGKSKGYAFIEFEFEEVAKIAAESMDGYLMYERLLKCKVLNSDVNSHKIFANRFMSETNCPKLKARKQVKSAQNKVKSEEEVKEQLKFRLEKLEEQNEKLAEKGIDYEFTPSTSA